MLVVDDEPGMRYMARRVFEDRFDVVEAVTGEEALQILEHRTCDFAVVDVRLPGLSGLDLLTRIKLRRPDMDVIVMTGSAHDPDEALEDSIRRKAFFFLRKPFPLSVLETLADRIVESQEMSEALAGQLRRLESDLEAARKFQRRLLPPREWRSEDGRVRIASWHVPSERLSGDFFDYGSLPGGETAVLVADVMGHGPSAAMVTGIVKSQTQRSLAENPDPAQTLTQLENELLRYQISGFLTAFLLVLDAEGVAYCGAGHPAAIGRRRDGTRFELASDGLPLNTGLGVPERRTWRHRLSPGDRIFLLTDGYTEGLGSGGMFGEPDEDGTRPLDTAIDRSVTEAPSIDRSTTGAPSSVPPIEILARFDAAWVEFTGDPESDDDRAAILVELPVSGPGPAA